VIDAETGSLTDAAEVEALLGRAPQGPFEVVVRDRAGTPVVIRNGPFLDDGTPMPTRYWLVGRALNREIGRLEGAGGVKNSEAAIDPNELAAAHDAYRAERDVAIDVLGGDPDRPRPSGGIGGTRRGVKCLHAHVAHHLATGVDPIGDWALGQLSALGVVVDAVLFDSGRVGEVQ
jgi:hypothetical protein